MHEEQTTGVNADAVLCPVPRKFKIGEREITIKPLVLAQYKKMGNELGSLIRQIIKEHPEIDLDKIEEHLPVILPLMGDAVGRLFEKLLGIEEEYLEQHLTLTQASEIVCAILEVNQVPVIRKNILRALQLARTTPTIN